MNTCLGQSLRALPDFLRKDYNVGMTTAAAFAVTLLSAPMALAHGPGSDWIWNNPETSWCCFMNKDCQPLPEDDLVELEPGVWRVKSTGQVFRQGERGTYPSKEMKPWACRPPGGPVRCLFYAGGAS